MKNPKKSTWSTSLRMINATEFWLTIWTKIISKKSLWSNLWTISAKLGRQTNPMKYHNQALTFTLITNPQKKKLSPKCRRIINWKLDSVFSPVLTNRTIQHWPSNPGSPLLSKKINFPQFLNFLQYQRSINNNHYPKISSKINWYSAKGLIAS